MNPLQEKGHKAAVELLELLDNTTPDERDIAGPSCAYPAVDALAEFAIALAVDQMADITRQLLLKHQQNPIIPPPQNGTPKP